MLQCKIIYASKRCIRISKDPLYVCMWSVKAGSHLFCLRRVATGGVYKMIWTRVRYAGIELFSIPASRRASKSFHMHFLSQRDASKKMWTSLYSVSSPFLPFIQSIVNPLHTLICGMYFSPSCLGWSTILQRPSCYYSGLLLYWRRCELF